MRELDSQQNRKIVRVDIDGKTYTIKNPYRDEAIELSDKLAEKLYDSIRTNHTDISNIAANLGFKADNIKKCKDHIFYAEHDLDRFAPAEPVERRRFDANLKQGLAWKRFEAGAHTDADIEWIKHECAERHHELIYGAGYSKSHDRAQKRYDGNPWEDEWDK